MWRRIKRTAEQLKKSSQKRDLENRAGEQSGASQSAASSCSRPSSSDFSLNSPLTRVLALRVGQGQPASLLQEVSQAAVRESHGHVSKSACSLLWKSFLRLNV